MSKAALWADLLEHAKQLLSNSEDCEDGSSYRHAEFKHFVLLQVAVNNIDKEEDHNAPRSTDQV